jgi:hypothetical protein
MISVAIGFEFEYAGKKYEHLFWSLPDLDNYFRWEPGRGHLVVGCGARGAVEQFESRSKNGKLRLIAVNEIGERLKQTEFSTYQEMIDFIYEKKIVVKNASGRKGLQVRL